MKIFGYDYDFFDHSLDMKQYKDDEYNKKLKFILDEINLSNNLNYLKIVNFLKSFVNDDTVQHILKLYYAKELHFQYDYTAYRQAVYNQKFDFIFYDFYIFNVLLPKSIIKEGFTDKLTNNFINKLQQKIEKQKKLSNSLEENYYDSVNQLFSVNDVGILTNNDVCHLVKVKGYKIGHKGFICFESLLESFEFNKRIEIKNKKKVVKSFIKINDDFKTQTTMLLLKK